MENQLYAITLAFLLGVWGYRSYQVIKTFNSVERLKGWIKKKGHREGTLALGQAKPGRFYLLRSFFRKILGGEDFLIRVRYRVGDTDIVCDRYSVLPKLRGKDRVAISRMVRDGIDEVDVFYDPQDPSQSVILPPSGHTVRGLMLKHILFTAMIFFALLVLVI